MKTAANNGRANSPVPTDEPPRERFGDLIACIGQEAAFLLVEKFGGTPIYVPIQVSAESNLSRLIGMAAMEGLVKLHGGTQLAIPLGKRWRIRVYRERGMSLNQIARTVVCEQATVSRVLQEMGMTGVPAPAATRAAQERKQTRGRQQGQPCHRSSTEPHDGRLEPA